MATEANLICYRGRTGVRERSEEVLFIHSLPRKVSSNEERSDGRRQRIARSFGPRKSAPFLPRYSSPQLRLRWCRHAAGRLLELRGTGGRAEAAASNINYDARSLARPPSLPLSLSRFIFIILEFPLLSDHRRRHAVPPSFLPSSIASLHATTAETMYVRAVWWQSRRWGPFLHPPSFPSIPPLTFGGSDECEPLSVEFAVEFAAQRKKGSKSSARAVHV